MIFGENKKLNQCYGSPPPGQFSLDVDPPKSPHWDHCREQFLGKMTSNMKGFYFSFSVGKCESVGEFLNKFEKVLGLPFYSTFCKTDRETILWIEPAPFWLNCILKRSLLTLLLRVGFNYDVEKDNFEDALFSELHPDNKYVRDTKNAIIRFMYGFTKYIGTLPSSCSNSWDGSSTLIKHGWHAEFENAGIQVVKNKLICPEKTDPIIVGIDSLWN